MKKKIESKWADTPRRRSQSADDNTNQPWVSNYPPLKAWLDKHNAQCMWQLPMQTDWRDRDMEHPTAYIECYLMPAVEGRPSQPFIVVVHANKNGWEILTPCDSTAIDATLLDAERRLGLVK